MTTTAWVIGARGLLGKAVATAIRSRHGWELLEAEPLPWNDVDALRDRVAASMRDLVAAAPGPDDRWVILWAAGAAITATTPALLAEELSQLTTILDVAGAQIGGSGSRGSIFYASSAGGVYGGSSTPPFTEETAPVPLSPYGAFKLDAEAAVASWAGTHGVSSLMGRIANLYGPGQKLEKMQGLISQIAKAQFSTTPAAIYVSLDTVRDYIFVNDCALLVCDAVDRLLEETAARGETHVVKILASGQGVTIGALLGHFRTLSKNHPHVMLGTSAFSGLQAHDLRLRSVVWTSLDARQLTPLPAGIHATIQDILSSLQISARS